MELIIKVKSHQFILLELKSDFLKKNETLMDETAFTKPNNSQENIKTYLRLER